MPDVPPPPASRVDDVVDIVHGVPVPDPYRWLEDGGSEDTWAWTEAQNARTRAVLDRLPRRAELHARLVELLRVGQSVAPRFGGDRLFSLDRWGDHDQAVLAVRDVDDPGPPEPVVLVDPAALGGDTTAAIDWYHPSLDGRLVAYGLSTGGDERSTLRVVDAGTGEHLDDEIADTRACSLAWEPDGTAFVYTVYPAGDEYHRHVRRHRIGGHPATDELVLGPDQLPDPTAWPSVVLARDGRWLLVELSLGWSRVDLRLLDRAAGTWTTVLEGVDAITSLSFDHHRSRFVGITTLDADRGRVVAADPTHPQPGQWRTLVPEADDPRAVTDWAVSLPSGLLVRRTRWGVAEVTWHDPQGAPVEAALPHGVHDIVGIAAHDDQDLAVWSLTSFTLPPTLERWRPGRPRRQWSTLPDPSGVTGVAAVDAEQSSYASPDGTAIPVFVAQGSDTPRRDAPTILTAYGGFAISQTPAWSPLVAAWCELGGRYAIAGIRGGFEEGEAWHRAGMREHKQQAFDDFLAAADWLVSEAHTTRDRLALRGGSNGGLLMGAAITQRPDVARAVHIAVPLADMVRFPHFLIARLWTPEYGDPDVPAEFQWLWGYSPYHRVVDDTCYPSVLVTTAEEDTRVDPSHARKLAARLQAATSCGHERPVLVRIEARAGHGVGKPVGKQADEAADVLAFLAWQLDR